MFQIDYGNGTLSGEAEEYINSLFLKKYEILLEEDKNQVLTMKLLLRDITNVLMGEQNLRINSMTILSWEGISIGLYEETPFFSFFHSVGSKSSKHAIVSC